MHELPQWLFDFYALSLPRGHGFGDHPPVEAWQSDDGATCGAVTHNDIEGRFGILAMRRRVDDILCVVEREHSCATRAEARDRMQALMREDEPREPLPSNTAARPALHDLRKRTPSDVFSLLSRPTHHPAGWALNQLYLALPDPDKNWVGDCQTENFHTRLWEAQLLGSFREQGLLVTQPYDSPDFRIENRSGNVAWVEAVTANPPEAYNHVNAKPSDAPKDRSEKFFGPSAERFAKTLGNKLAKQYHTLDHVDGKPFMIAIADFHAPGSMTWSREGLIGYLYGQGASEGDRDGKRLAVSFSASYLSGPSAFPAGLFADDKTPELSAVIFSNACSISKLNRVPISASKAPDGYLYMRVGNFFDRTPGALKSIPFCLDITSAEYRSLWPQGYEPWSAELEVFHNPHAKHPVPFELVPEATHWFDQGGEMICSSFYEHSILSSRTLILDADGPIPSIDDFLDDTIDSPR